MKARNCLWDGEPHYNPQPIKDSEKIIGLHFIQELLVINLFSDYCVASRVLNILNAISYAPHILLMTAEVNESQFPKFSFQFIWHWSHNNTFKRKLFCRIPVFFTILWDLSRGYKTKVITLPPKISTITSNEEKNMTLSLEMLNSFNTCSSRLKCLFLCKFMFLGENGFFTISESNIRKISKISLKACSMG